MSKTKARLPRATGASGYETSVPRTVLAVLLVVVGIAWVTVYLTVARDAAQWQKGLGPKPSDQSGFMAPLGDWNILIGFAILILGLFVSAHPTTPMGRGRGVVVGMLAFPLLGLLWIVVFYFVGNSADVKVPLMDVLGQKNLFLGIAFIAVGFFYAVHWE